MKFVGIRHRWYALGQWGSQYRMAKKYGGRRALLTGALSGPGERFWLCRVRRQHREKFASGGLCVRCGKPVR